MYTQSLIQQRINIVESKYRFEEKLKQILENYTVKDNVVVFNGRDVVDIEEGYFVRKEEYGTLEEAIRNINLNTQGIRIIEEGEEGDHKFIIGDVCRSLNECMMEKSVYNIGRMEDVC